MVWAHADDDFERPQEDRPMLALLLLFVAVSILSLQDRR